MIIPLIFAQPFPHVLAIRFRAQADRAAAR
jgi:hypothetical protein